MSGSWEMTRWIGRGYVRAGVGLLVAMAGGGSAIEAQEQSGPCESYAECALRVESGGFFSSGSIVRGTRGEKVAGIGSDPVLDTLFGASDEAAAWYDRFERSHRTATWLGGAGALLYLAGGLIPLLSERSDGDGPLVLGLSIGGFGLSFASGFPGRSAQRSLSRAIWWYNAGLAR